MYLQKLSLRSLWIIIFLTAMTLSLQAEVKIIPGSEMGKFTHYGENAVHLDPSTYNGANIVGVQGGASGYSFRPMSQERGFLSFLQWSQEGSHRIPSPKEDAHDGLLALNPHSTKQNSFHLITGAGTSAD